MPQGCDVFMLQSGLRGNLINLKLISSCVHLHFEQLKLLCPAISHPLLTNVPWCEEDS